MIKMGVISNNDDYYRYELEKYLNKIKVLGLPISHTRITEDIEFYNIPGKVGILYIPKTVNKLSFELLRLLRFNRRNYLDRLKVIGGSGLETTRSMFANYKDKRIQLDLTLFDTHNVVDMSHMFANHIITGNELRNLNTSKVENMKSMFASSKIDNLDLSSFDTSNVKNMCQMFCSAEAGSIKFGTFNTSNVTNMNAMFRGFKVPNLGKLEFDTHNVLSAQQMFKECETESIDISQLDFHNALETDEMFYECKAKTIRVDDTKFNKNSRLANIFYNSACASISLTTLENRALDTEDMEVHYLAVTKLQYEQINRLKALGIINGPKLIIDDQNDIRNFLAKKRSSKNISRGD